MRATLCLLLLAPLAACAPEGDLADGIDDAFAVGGKADSLSTSDTAAVLHLVNTATLEQLDVDAGLDARAAKAIIDHRVGPDGRQGTRDDDPFDTLAELDAVPWVGPVALEKLRAFAAQPTADGPGCLIISEYVEGQGNYNKAVELYNCGGAALSLADYQICLVRDNAQGCTLTSDLGDATLPAGGVTTVCRQKSGHPTSLDPSPVIRAWCQLERPGVMTFSGDDRLVVLHRDGAIVDALGRIAYRPPADTWTNGDYRRCNLTPNDGLSFYETSRFFTRHPAGNLDNFGQPPTPGCP